MKTNLFTDEELILIKNTLEFAKLVSEIESAYFRPKEVREKINNIINKIYEYIEGKEES